MDVSQNSRNTSASLAETHEQEVILLKEKVEHFKHVIHKLQEDLQSQKIRKEGAETVSKLLQESKQEVLTLKKKIRTYESVIRNLQSRLENHGISSEITLHEGEQYLPGHSKQILDNLTRENSRLRNLIRNENGDPEELVRLQKQCQDIQKDYDELKIVTENYRTQVEELKKHLGASDNDKDVTVAKLKKELEHAKQELHARNTLCSTLAEESQSLQKQLKDVAEQCQDLAKKLADKRSSGVTSDNKSTEVKSHENKTATEENEVLQRKLKEITEMNMRWQEYDKQREANMTKLKQELSEVKSRAATGSVSRDLEIQVNRVLDEAKRDVMKANAEKDKVTRELEIAKASNKSLTAEINQLRKKLESSPHKDSAETIEALKAQIQICTEDFESERKDREKAQTRLAKLEAENDQMRRENEALKRAQIQRTPVTGNEYGEPFFHYQGLPGGFGHEGLAARGSSKVVSPRRHIDKYNVIDGAPVQSDGENEASCKRSNEDDTVSSKVSSDQTVKEDLSDRHSDGRYESLRTSSLSSSFKGSHSSSPRQSPVSSPVDVPPHPDQSSSKQSEILKCPKCDKEFHANEHVDLLEHIEMCCE